MNNCTLHREPAIPGIATESAQATFPHTVYHGTNEVFDEFIASEDGLYGAGIYFADTRDFACQYGSIIISAQLNLLNPWVINAVHDSAVAKRELFDHPAIEAILALPNGRALVDEAIDIGWELFDTALQDEIKSLGHDGIIANYVDGSKQIIAFHSHQVSINGKEIISPN
ncbi:ADP-ribosyltransferase-containing protein [Cellvibrio sp. QJXJ]|uniref:ADP-ribosyltransferase-containing protein n=1 Tax=Cellvibrio sp. QJXJ TaxID=2964606 RepID=UPI0021C28F84|nr:hypothetical protein [Cellvibrio sp. QJXJ]UUA75143.1 hypothetical protein NNX04_22055 [Cellvibrio sp. QJXJ]